MSEIITAIAIHFVVPLSGIAVFLWLCFLMKKARIPEPPFVPWFVLFFTFGGWLIVGLTTLFWEWSGMASLGVFFLILVAPWITAQFAWRLRDKRALSAFHKAAFLGNAVYSVLMLVLVLAWMCN